MGGYRGQIKRACRELGRRGRVFDLDHVLAKIPDGPYRPTERQAARLLSKDPDLVVVDRDRNGNRQTTYMLRRYRRDSSNVSVAVNGRGDRGPHRTPGRRRGSPPARRPLAASEPEDDEHGKKT